MQDEVRAESLEQSLELHVLQMSIHRPRELDELQGRATKPRLRRCEAPPAPPWPPETVIWEQLMTQSLQHLHHKPHLVLPGDLSRAALRVQGKAAAMCARAFIYWGTGFLTKTPLFSSAHKPLVGDKQGHVPIGVSDSLSMSSSFQEREEG